MILGFVLMTLGCVSDSTGTKINSNYPIVYVNPPTISSGSDYVSIGGYIKNIGRTNYKVVQLSVMGLDENGNLILQKTVVVTSLNADQKAGYQTTWTTQKKVKSAKLDIISVK